MKGGREAQICQFEAMIEPVPDKGGSFVRVPLDIKAVFKKGRIKVHAEFDGEPYDGSVVNMGVKNADGSVCYIIGVRKDILKRLKKGAGDSLHVILYLESIDNPAKTT